MVGLPSLEVVDPMVLFKMMYVFLCPAVHIMSCGALLVRISGAGVLGNGCNFRDNRDSLRLSPST